MIARKYNDQELLQIENDRAFVLIGDCPSSDDTVFTSHGCEYRQNKGVLGLEYAEFGMILEVWHYMLDCEYYKMGQASFNEPKRRDQNLQLISDYVKGNIGEKKLRKIYRKIALETADAELKEFFQDLKENSIVSYKMRGNNQ